MAASDKDEKKVSTTPLPDIVPQPPVAEMEKVVPPIGYNINRLFNATGATKNPTLDEINAAAFMQRQGLDPNVSTNTANDVVKAILNRAGLTDSPQKEDLEFYFTYAMNKFILDPVLWQNPQSPHRS